MTEAAAERPWRPAVERGTDRGSTAPKSGERKAADGEPEWMALYDARLADPKFHRLWTPGWKLGRSVGQCSQCTKKGKRETCLSHDVRQKASCFHPLAYLAASTKAAPGNRECANRATTARYTDSAPPKK